MTRVVLALAVACAAAVALAGLGHRWGWWSYQAGFLILRVATYAGALLAVAALAALGAGLWRQRWGSVGLALVALAVVAAGLWVPLGFLRTARRVPVIHDVSTDLERPPAFVTLAAQRPPGVNPLERPPDLAAQQRAGYPDLEAAEVPWRPEETVDRAATVARQLGWVVVAAAPGEGRLEATETTRWWGFTDDVVVRVTPSARGSRVDVRSVSRVGRSDLGVNARRIRTFLRALQAAAR